MRIQKADIARMAKVLRETLDTRGIRSITDLEGRVDIIKLSDKEGIIIQKKQLRNTSYVFNSSYIIKGTGVPLEIGFNPTERYTKVFLKLQDKLPEYAPFMQDTFGNIMQCRIFQVVDIETAKRELEYLASLK
jgi:hypothetical protein